MTNDLRLIHTQGLDEGIRCAMCTNTMKSDKGCDGGCVVDQKMYEKVLKVIDKALEAQSTDADCINREQALLALTGMDLPTDRDKLIALFTERIQHLPPVTPQSPKGKWIEVLEHRDEFGSTWHYECSECRARSYKGFKPLERYCPNCGAEMIGGGEECNSMVVKSED